MEIQDSSGNIWDSQSFSVASGKLVATTTYSHDGYYGDFSVDSLQSSSLSSSWSGFSPSSPSFTDCLVQIYNSNNSNIFQAYGNNFNHCNMTGITSSINRAFPDGNYYIIVTETDSGNNYQWISHSDIFCIVKMEPMNNIF